jgi:hypothetical protein
MTDVLVVDRKGLAKKLAKKPKAFLVFELLSNAWDENVTHVKATIEAIPGRPACRITVEDDCPEGFQDLTSIYTMFKDSKKASDPEKRGRFEIGEKLVLALAQEARITTTKGTIIIENDERRSSREKREAGTTFEGVFKLTREEIDEVCKQVRQAIPPANIKTTFNGEVLEAREPLHTFETTLQTVRVDEEGNLKETSRKTVVEVFEVQDGETAHIYEMGIPVVETGDRWHYNVLQRVPINWERNNVPPSYKTTLRVEVVNAMHDKLTVEDSKQAWVSNALDDERIEAEAATTVMDKRFGKKRAIFDASDPESNKALINEGYTIIPGGALSGAQWSNVKSHGLALPSGVIKPSGVQYGDGPPEKVLFDDELSPGMQKVRVYVEDLSFKLIGKSVAVRFVNEPIRRANASAWYGGREITFNVGRLGKAWFNEINQATNALVIHELTHEVASDHFTREFYHELQRLGAKLAHLCLMEPEFFTERGYKL